MSKTFYSYKQYKEYLNKINELTNGKYYTKLWNGFLNYYNKETHERIGYEAIQSGYYIINND